MFIIKRKRFKRTILTSAIVGTSLSMSGCLGNLGCVYGPPPVQPNNNSEITTPSSQAENFDPSDNIPQDVYGPPVEESFNDESQLPDKTSSEENDFDPSDEIPALVYGPPSDM